MDMAEAVLGEAQALFGGYLIVPLVRFHNLRHTAATPLLGRVVHPKIVSQMLRHSQIAIIFDLHSHAIPAVQRQVAKTLVAILSR